MSGKYAEGTTVSPEASQMEIKRTVVKHGAVGVVIGDDAHRWRHRVRDARYWLWRDEGLWQRIVDALAGPTADVSPADACVSVV